MVGTSQPHPLTEGVFLHSMAGLAAHVCTATLLAQGQVVNTVRHGPVRDDLTPPSLRTTPVTTAVSHCLPLSQDELARNSLD